MQSKLVPVDGDGKVVPCAALVERRLKQHAAVVRADAEHTRGVVRQRRIEWGSDLEVEDVRPVTRLDEHGLILVLEVQLPLRVRLHRKMERGEAALELLRVERGAVPARVRLRDELAAAEAELRRVGAGREDGRVVDGRAERLLLHRLPERRRGEDAVREESEVVAGTLIPFHHGQVWAFRLVEVGLCEIGRCPPVIKNWARPPNWGRPDVGLEAQCKNDKRKQ